MLLALDCGNTHITVGVYHNKSLIANWRLGTDPQKTEDEYMVLLRTLIQNEGLAISDISGVALGSVVPGLDFAFRKLFTRHFNLEPFYIDNRTDTGITIDMPHPQEVGSDRIINAAAAHQLYQGDLIVVDFGTATTFDVVTGEGVYLGGAIAPGVEISRQALFARAARLAHIPLERPQHAIGKTTAESLQSGTVWGFGGQVDGIVGKMCAELPTKPTVIATGGLASFIAVYSERIMYVEPFLTLEGLRMIYERSHGLG